MGDRHRVEYGIIQTLAGFNEVIGTNPIVKVQVKRRRPGLEIKVEESALLPSVCPDPPPRSHSSRTPRTAPSSPSSWRPAATT